MLENNGGVFNHQDTMGTMGSNNGNISEREMGYLNTVYTKFYNNFLYNIFTPPYKMAETALAWKLLWMFGFSITGVSYLTAWNIHLGEIDFSAMPEPFKNVMYFFSCVFLGVACWRSYQKGRSQQLSNREKEYEIELKKSKRKPPNETNR